MEKRKYAFIDVLNTGTTTQQLLGFLIDWGKLRNHLRDEWKCDKIFFYTGIEVGDIDAEKEFQAIQSPECIVKAKAVIAYKKRPKIIENATKRDVSRVITKVYSLVIHKSSWLGGYFRVVEKRVHKEPLKNGLSVRRTMHI